MKRFFTKHVFMRASVMLLMTMLTMTAQTAKAAEWPSYITDFIVIDTGTGTEAHNPPSELTFDGRKYYLCPAAGGDYFANSNHGNLTSQAANG